MRRAVEATQANLQASLPTLTTADRERGLFGGDRALGAWFGQVLDDDIVYLDATRDRARDLIERVDAIVRRRLQDREPPGPPGSRPSPAGALQPAADRGHRGADHDADRGPGVRLQGAIARQGRRAIVALLGAVAFYLAARVLTLALPHRGGLFAWVGHLAAGTAVAMLVWTVLAWTHGFGLRSSLLPGVTLTLACAASSPGRSRPHSPAVARAAPHKLVAVPARADPRGAKPRYWSRSRRSRSSTSPGLSAATRIIARPRRPATPAARRASPRPNLPRPSAAGRAPGSGPG